MLRTTTRDAAPAAQTEYMKAGSDLPPLTAAEEKLLGTRWRHHGDERALDLLVQSHLRLAVRIAFDFRRMGPPMDDLIQEAMVGLTIAARRFDPGRRTRLSTYATYWIRACILEHVVRTRGPVRIGTTRAQRRILFGLGREQRRLFAQGREPDQVELSELAAALRVSTTELAALLPRLAGRDISLDDSRLPHDSIPGLPLRSSQPSPEQRLADRQEWLERQRLFAAALRKLEEREREIVMARHLCGHPETLAALGERFGLSRERVRQLETHAKSRLRELCGAPPPRRRRPGDTTH